MRGRKFNLALACGFFCIMLLFLFTAITYAECVGGDICVDSPAQDDELVSGHGSYVELSINPTGPTRYAAQYRVYMCCCEGTSCTPGCSNEEWGNGGIALQGCDRHLSSLSFKLAAKDPVTYYYYPISGCPETFLWVPPPVGEEGRTCRLAAVLLDDNVNPLATQGHVIDKGFSGYFTIKPFGEPVASLDLTPGSKTVGPGGPAGLAIGRANYKISGGVPPFTVAVYMGTYPPPLAINNYISINGDPVYPPKTFVGPTEFTVSNKVSTSCTGGDKTLTILVQDDALSIALASYVIQCSP